MSKLIRSKQTKSFLTEDGQWTNSFQSAAEFPDQLKAHNAVQKFQLHDVELYYLFEKSSTSEYDFTISLS